MEESDDGIKSSPYYKINDPDRGSSMDSSVSHKRSRKRLIIILLCIIVVLLAIGVLLLILFLKRSDDDAIKSGYNGYVATNPTDLKSSYSALLRRNNNVNYPIEVDDEKNKEFKELRFDVCMPNDKTYWIRYRPENETSDRRYTLPGGYLKPVDCDKTLRLGFGGFSVDISPFGFSLKNPAKDSFWLSTKDRNLVFSDKYVEIGFEISSQQVFGWGERKGSYLLEQGEYTIWPNGRNTTNDPGKRGYSTFGDHPFLLARNKDRTFIGIFFKNSNAKVLRYTKESKGRSVVNFVSVGGTIEVFAFYGESAEEVLKQYHQIIGQPYLPAIWAFGWQAGSTGYSNDTLAAESVDNFTDNGIPLEVLWLDEQYQDNYHNFKVDTVNFKNIKALRSKLKNDNQRLGISLHSGYAVYDSRGNKDEIYKIVDGGNAFIKSATNNTEFNDNLIGEGLPGKVAFLDYFHPMAYIYWTTELKQLLRASNYDALQLNMNEITQFCDGECPDNSSFSEKYDDLPYNPLGDQNGLKLKSNTITMDSTNWVSPRAPENNGLYIGYNTHSIYSLIQTHSTSSFLVGSSDSPSYDQRNQLLTRGSFAGTGQYASHYLSDYDCTFEDMKRSILDIFNFQLFGMPHTGAPVCGDKSDIDQEVCARWYQLGAFYPFARTNFDGKFGLKEPWALEGQYLDAARNAIITRYSLIRYIYTVMFEINQDGGSLWRPLFFEFPKVDETVKNIGSNFMIGKSVIVTPVLEHTEESTKVKTYIPPNTRYVDLIDLKTVKHGGSKGSYQYLEPRWDFPLIHLRDGRIIPYQKFNESSRTVELVSAHKINILIFPDTSTNAEGTLYIDKDGVSQKTIRDGTYQYYKVTYNDKKIRFTLTKGYDAGGSFDANQLIENITIIDSDDQILSNTTFACKFDENMDYSPLNFTYNENTKTLNIFDTDQTTALELRTLKGIQFGNGDSDENLCGVEYTVENISKVKSGPMAGKSLSVEVGPNHKGLRSFTANFTLIKDNLINIDFIPDIRDEPFDMPPIVLNQSLYPITEIYAEGNIDSYVTVAGLNEKFYFEIHTKDNPSDILYTTKDQPLTYTQYYKSMTSRIYTDGRYFGLGERVGDFWLKAGSYTVWNRGPVEQEEDNGEPPGKSLYGSHPVLFVKRKNSDKFFVIYDHNSSPQEYVFQIVANGRDLTTVKASGRTNLFFIMEGTLPEVTSQYYELVGRPILPPKWGFGWHQSRYGYKNTTALKNVIIGYRNESIPLDAIWNDVDYLEDFKDFTIDEEAYGDLGEFVDEIHKENIHYVPIIGSGISAGDSEAYFDGRKRGIFMRSNKDESEPLIGKYTPGDVVFVDFYEPTSENFWQEQLNKLHDKVSFDGIWLDGNEITNFCNGVCYESQRAKDPIDNKLLYWPGGRDLETRTVSLDAMHYGDNKEIDVHSLYGLIQGYRTKEWYKLTDTRPFVISRSTFAGSGKYQGHWTGDNKSNNDWMGNSVTSAFLFNFFGIPFVGSDICGFYGNSSAYECSKWYKIGAIYPFARNHNDLEADDQEPYTRDFQTKIDYSYNYTGTQIIKKASLIRYSLHVYTYSQFHKASTEGIPPFRPLFYDFPNDTKSYDYVESNVMLGPSIKASPHYTTSERNTYYFPEKGMKWCPIFPGKLMDCFIGGSYQSISIPNNEIILHLKSGSIVPMQLMRIEDYREFRDVKTLSDLKNLTIDLLMQFQDNEASGYVRFDDGETTNITLYDEIIFTAETIGGGITKRNMIVDLNITHSMSPNNATQTEKLGDLYIYDSESLGYEEKTTGEIELNDGENITLTSDYDVVRKVNRLSHTIVRDIHFADIKQIRIYANQT